MPLPSVAAPEVVEAPPPIFQAGPDTRVVDHCLYVAALARSERFDFAFLIAAAPASVDRLFRAVFVTPIALREKSVSKFNLRKRKTGIWI